MYCVNYCKQSISYMHSSVTKVLIFCKTKSKTCNCLSYFNTAGIFFACERRYGLVKKRS